MKPQSTAGCVLEVGWERQGDLWELCVLQLWGHFWLTEVLRSAETHATQTSVQTAHLDGVCGAAASLGCSRGRRNKPDPPASPAPPDFWAQTPGSFRDPSFLHTPLSPNNCTAEIKRVTLFLPSHLSIGFLPTFPCPPHTFFHFTCFVSAKSRMQTS